MNGKQQVVAVGGLGLILVNYWTGPGKGAVSKGFFDPGADVAAAHGQLKAIGAELLFVAIATVLAGIADSWGTAMVTVIVALFVLWAMNHYGKGTGG